jgi:hypothetical protein
MQTFGAAEMVESSRHLRQSPSMQSLSFKHLNPDWNAEPNAPSLQIKVVGDALELRFLLNPYAYEAKDGDVATLRFEGCRRWRWDATNDHGWFAGRGRFSGQAPSWGEFYEITPVEPRSDDLDWEIVSPDTSEARHFLFYFRDETIECVATSWSLHRSKSGVR